MEWIENDNLLTKKFTLESFSEIMNALPQLAVIADGMDHHPDFKVHGYKNITFSLSTHSEGKVTEKDWKLAAEIDRILEN